MTASSLNFTFVWHQDLGKKQLQQTSPCKTIIGFAWAMYVRIPEPLALVRVYPHGVGGYLLDYMVFERDGSPKGRAVCTQTILDHHEYSSYIFMSDIDEAHIVPINSFSAKMRGLQGSIWSCFQCSWALGILPQDVKSSEDVALLNRFSDSKPPRWQLMSLL